MVHSYSCWSNPHIGAGLLFLSLFQVGAKVRAQMRAALQMRLGFGVVVGTTQISTESGRQSGEFGDGIQRM